MASPAMSFIGLIIMFVMVVVPLVAGIVMIISSRRGGLGYPACGRCRYNLTSLIGKADRCPECGASFAEAGVLPQRGPRKPLLLWGGVALILLPLTCVGFGTWSAQQSLHRARAAAQAARAAALRQQQYAQQQVTVESPPSDTDDNRNPDASTNTTGEAVSE